MHKFFSYKYNMQHTLVNIPKHYKIHLFFSNIVITGIRLKRYPHIRKMRFYVPWYIKTRVSGISLYRGCFCFLFNFVYYTLIVR